jgi:hypothetical protein
MGYNMDIYLAELIGIILGDGCLVYNEKKGNYYCEIVGNPSTEMEYYEKYIRKLVRKVFDRPSSINVRERGVRLKFYSKKVIGFIVNDLGLFYGKGKNLKAKIPDVIFKDYNLRRACLRGLIETDGSFYFSRKGKNLNYPSIEFTTTSKVLAIQVNQALVEEDFRVSFREEPREIYANAFRIGIYGVKQVEKWVSDIGFSKWDNQKKLRGWREKLK